MALTMKRGYRYLWDTSSPTWKMADLLYGEYMKKPPKIMAKAFDLATCQNGHPRYIISRGVREGVRVDGKDFVPIGASPTVTVSVQLFDMKCPDCGAKVFQPTDDGNYGLKFYNRGSLVGEGKYVPAEAGSADLEDSSLRDTTNAKEKLG